MTYCAGWKYKGTAFLIADTAVTKSAKVGATYSSFGQLHTEVRGEYVEEALLKLVPLGDGTVAAFAGDVELAAHCLDFLRDGLSTSNSMRGLLQSLTNSLGPFQPDRVVELLIATSTDNCCDLVHWNTLQGVNPTENDYYQIGSLTSFHSALTPTLLSKLVAGNADTERLLPTLTAIVQSYGVHDNLIDMNVGGLIFGIKSTRGVVEWQPDTNFVIYDPASTNISLITAIARDNTLVLNSSLTNEIKVFCHSTSMQKHGLWDEQWLAKTIAELDSGKSHFWIFISASDRVITVIFRPNVNNESRYVQLTNLGAGKFDLALSHELVTLLHQPLVNRNDGSLPFRLNVRND